jgi:hypothetical protein
MLCLLSVGNSEVKHCYVVQSHNLCTKGRRNALYASTLKKWEHMQTQTQNGDVTDKFFPPLKEQCWLKIDPRRTG